eukprot:GCRY01003040.1.p1 GENE.GCRY01003040.1~~GCRY01003040.1.p1  ORF type:complete len:324 (+),score=28.76 GCRY01003040.1:207-1178(+)
MTLPTSDNLIVGKEWKIQELSETNLQAVAVSEFNELNELFPNSDAFAIDGNWKSYCSVGLKHPDLNRYGNVFPFDWNYVKYPRIPYVNASYISDGFDDKKFIATQGPPQNTHSLFWAMILQENASLLLMVTNVMEMSFVKCEPYWPAVGESFTFPHPQHPQTQTIIVTNEDHSEDCVRNCVVRTLRITVEEKGSLILSHCVRQLHYIGWPDCGVPPNTDGIWNLLLQAAATKGRVVIHCSAGVGRTGVVIALFNLCRQFSRQKRQRISPEAFTFNLQKIVTIMRQQRMMMVQTPIQYLFCLKSVPRIVSSLNEFIAAEDASHS